MIKTSLVAAVALALSVGLARADGAEHALPVPAVDESPTTGPQTAVFSGGCFWGVQGVFEHVKGVARAVSGYAGGNVANPNYEQDSSGTTGHAESVRVTFDPAEAYHQDYLDLHPDQPYVAINDIPKVEALRTLFPGNWQPTPVKVGKLASTD